MTPKLRTLSLLCLLALAVPTSALAKGKPEKPSKPEGTTAAVVMQGTLVSADAAANSAVVQVTRANPAAASRVGQQVTVDVSKAELRIADANADGKNDLADSKAGDRVIVQAAELPADAAAPVAATRFQDLTAKKPRPRPALFQGTLVSVDAAANTAVVEIKRASRYGKSRVGQQVTVNLAKAKLQIRDINGDGKRDLGDAKAGDRISFNVRNVPADAAAALDARVFVDRPAKAPKPTTPDANKD